MSGSGGDKHGRPLASVHRLDPDRPKRGRILPKTPAAPNEQTPAPDRNAALSMLGTFDLDDVDFRSPDEALASLVAQPPASEGDDRPQASPTDQRAITRDIPAVDDVPSDEILRELEEHHQRGQTIPRPSAPRGSAELDPARRRRVPPAHKREIQGRGSGESKLRDGRSRLVLSLVVAAGIMATASAVTLSHLGDGSGRRPSSARSSSLAATTGFTLTPTNPFETAANAIAREDQERTRRVGSPVRHRHRVATVRKRSTRHHLITHATVAPASTSPATSSASYSGSSSVTTSNSQPATTTAAAAISSNTSQQSQPAFGLNGSLGPGRGAPGTQ